MSSGRLILPLAEPAITNAFTQAVGATLTVYVAGGSTLASLFADAALATPITNPQTADASGRFYAQSVEIWADATQAYDCVLAFTDGESFTYHNIYLLGAATNTSGFAPINSPAFTGVPTAPTPALNDSTIKLATTAYVQGQGYAPLASPALTGTPTAPTAASGTNTTQLATTAFVLAALGAISGNLSAKGHVVIPIGGGGSLILNWGFATSGFPGSSSVTFDMAFPNAAFSAVATSNVTSPTTVSGLSKTGMTINAGGSTTGAWWIVLGN